MKKIRYLIFLPIASLMFLNMDCNKNDECEVITQAPQEFLDYWFFPVGSWWVYKNQDGEFDTVTCTIRESNFYTPDDANGLIPCLYYYICYYKHSNKHYFPDTGMYNTHKIQGVSSNNGIYWNLLASNSNNYYYFEYFFKYPFNIRDTIDYLKIGSDKYLSIIEGNDSFTINNNKIYDVVRIFHFNDKLEAKDYRKYIWIGINIGIIKVQYSFGDFWELLDYKINK